jgi:ADP-heptose:LPS heptosyltransferase
MLKVPQLTIFGPTDPLFVKPFSPNSHIITPRHNVIVYKTGRGFIDNPRKSVINQLTVEEVFAKVKKLMKKYRI